MGTSSRGHPAATDRMHRVAIQLGAVAAAVTIVVYAVWALADGDPIHLTNGIGPVVLGAVCLLMLRSRWYHGEIVLILAAVSTIFSFKFYGEESTSAPAAIGVVIIVSVSALFVPERWKWHHVWFGGLILLATGVFWEGFTKDAIWIGISGSLSAMVAMVLFIKMRDVAIASDRRYRILVEKLPLPLLQEDWTMVRRWMEERRAAGVTDIEAYLDAHPDELDRLVQWIRIQAVNPAINDLIGSVKKPDPAADDADLAPFVRSEVIALWHGADPRAADYRLGRKDGSELWARLEAVDIEPGLIDGVDRVIVATDVTELKQAQSELAEQVRSKDEFIAAVSHELRTPLTSVLGFAELINDESDRLPPVVQEMAERLLGEANDMAHIIEDLLVAARAEIGAITIDLEQLNLAAVGHNTIGDLDESFVVYRNEEPLVLADRVRIGQIIRNLAS
ncbi:MAG: histidine kinase dimerization/phospho-acceptor domain-containing protein, partial [Acidimicrobiia bacterium]|nr:histidine kinase dimerization/phospho-acceptor domain-containing protein [Acidimicrobiia bacterium]